MSDDGLRLDVPTDLSELPERFRDVRYDGERHPCAPGVSGVEEGANCQQYAYQLLRHYGLKPPALRSSEFIEDAETTCHVDELAPLDLLFWNATGEPFGSHVGVYLGDGCAVHLCAEVGKPVVWGLEEFAQRPRYRVLVAIKRVVNPAR